MHFAEVVSKFIREKLFEIKFDELVKSLPSCHCERSEAISINPSL
jgi:hypothetical protein